MEDVLTRMKGDIHITPIGTNLQTGRPVPAMQIEYAYHDRMLAMKVCSDLVSRFVASSSQEELNSQVSAESFLNDEFENAKRSLDAADQKLQDFKVKNEGKLPEEMQQNIASMTALEQRLSSLTDAQTRNAEQRMMLETQLRTAKDRLGALKTMGTTSVVKTNQMIETDKQIDNLQMQIASMEDRYQEGYPELQSAKEQLVVLKHQRETLAKASNNASEGSPESMISQKDRMDSQAQVDSIQGALNAAKLAEAANVRDISAVNMQLHEFEGRIQASPAGEKEYTDLMRDHEIAKTTFEESEKKLQLAKDSLNLSRQKQGETLEVLDPASTPTAPTAPKRSLYVPLGLVAGLILGFILVAIREVRDTSLKNLKDARLYTNLSILGSIPLLQNDVVVQRRKQVMWVGWATATILGLAIMAGSVAHYFLTKT